MSVEGPSLVVLAAGMGSRYGGLKQIDPVGPAGETLLDYSIFDAVRAGFRRVIFVIRHDIEEAFVARVGAKYDAIEGVEVDYAFQELDDLPDGFELPPARQKPWGTAHATLAARNLIDGPFVVVNADDFYGRKAFEMLVEYLRAGGEDIAMVGFVLRDTLSPHGTVTRGVCRTDGEWLQTIDELSGIAPDGDGATYPGGDGQPRSLSGDETVSMNFWGFPASVMGSLQSGLREFLEVNRTDPDLEYLLPDRVDQLIAAGDARVRVLPGGGPWFGVTYQEDRSGVMQSIRKLVDEGEYPEKLWSTSP
ncbi:MAG: NTP transferase domain-containing protein [Acidobacteriota bacterium]|jgi:hypothetical protein